MNKAFFVVITLFASVLSGLAQGVNPLAPSSVTPKAPPKTETTTPFPASDRPRSPRSPDGDKPLYPDQPKLAIRAVVITKSRSEIHVEGGTAATPLVVKDIPFLEGHDFEMVVRPFIGRQLTDNAIRDLEDAVILYCRERGKVLVDVILLEQDLSNGVLQLWFLEGKVGKIVVQNEGRKWFKDNLILSNVRLHPGDSVDANQLTQDLAWLNGNPFRQVDVAFKPGDKLGMTDVELRVDDRFPVRPYVGYEDSGTRFTGEDRLLAGFNWGNVFGLDHQLNYQYSTDVNFDLVKAHSASYIAPLPWRHTLTLYGSYVDGKADFTPIGSTTTANGHSWQISARYSVPLPSIGKYQHEVSAGFDFKRSNNNLESGGNLVLQNSDTDVAQFEAGYSGLMPDRWGRTALGAEFYYSPGGLTGNNSDFDFNMLRTASKADYMYGRANLERITRMPCDFSWVVKVWGQLAGDRLLPSEQLALGGYSTVRGYDERVVTGDDALIVNNEIRTPPMFPINWAGYQKGIDGLQLLGFFDFGAVRQVHVLPQDGANPNPVLYSTGVGLRYTISKNFSFRFDYGFPLTDKSLNEFSSRGHVGVLISF